MLKIFVLTLLLVSTVLSASLMSPLEHDGRIIGGNEVRITQHPHQVSMRYKRRDTNAYSHVCGGSINKANVIITAAHCVKNRSAKNFIIVSGTEIRNGGDGAVARVKKIIIHEKYNASNVNNDIALMILSTPLPLNNITIASIELATKVPEHGVKSVITGWGTTVSGGVASDKLLGIEVPIISNSRCDELYGPGKILETMLCAGIEGVGDKDACKGDSGGPLLVNRELTGVVSWGRGCALPDYPGVYTSIPYFKDWIDKNTHTEETFDFL